jgi:hypothetical protein
MTVQPTTYYSNDNVSGEVELYPYSADFCLPVEIRIHIAFQKVVAVGEYVVINMPGITSGMCEVPNKGRSIAELIVGNSSQLVGRYIEGDYADNFRTSRVRFTVVAPLLSRVRYYIRIDRVNNLKRTCMHEQRWGVVYGHNPPPTIDGPLPTVYSEAGSITFRDNHPLNCFQYYTGLSFYPPYPQQRTTVNFTFMIPFTLRKGDYVTLTLPGFTNKVGNYPLDMMVNTTAPDYRLGVGKDVYGMNTTSTLSYTTATANVSLGEVDLTLTYSTKYLWRGTWHEGTNTSGTLAFNHSTLILYPLGDEVNSKMIWVALGGFENHLISQLGRVANYSGFTVEIYSQNFRLNRTKVMTSTGIGPGCDDFGGCHNQGVCNYEYSR